MNVSFISWSASIDAGCSLGLLNGCFGLVSCPSLLVRIAVIADPERRRLIALLNRRLQFACCVSLSCLENQQCGYQWEGRYSNLLSFAIGKCAVKHHCCLPLNCISPFLPSCGSVASSSSPSVHRNVRMWTGCYHQCPYLCLAGATENGQHKAAGRVLWAAADAS